MDYLLGGYSGSQGRLNDYYGSQVLYEAGKVEQHALSASKFIKNSVVRMQFVNEVKAFTRHCIDGLSCTNSDMAKKAILDSLRTERQFLATQENMMRYDKAKQYASLEIKKDKDTGFWFYVLKGVGIVAGVAQVVVGGIILLGGSLTVVGAIAGTALILHGASNIEENALALYYDDPDYKGFARRGYEYGASALGFDPRIGSMVYGGVDLALSGYGALRHVLKPDAWRLFRYINTDFIRSYKTMSGTALGFEMTVDGLVIKSIYDSMPKEDK